MKKVLCPGEALIDFVANDNLGDLKKSKEFLKKAGGAPVNAAGIMAKLGIDAYFMGNVGNDPFGKFLEQTLENNKINTKYLYIDNMDTTLAFVSLDDFGDRDFKFNRGADENLKFNDFDKLKDFSCFHFASATAFLGGNLEKTYFNLLEYAYQKGKLITFDANYREALFEGRENEFIEKSIKFISKSDIVKLSEEEVKLIAKEEDIVKAGHKIKKMGCKYLIISLGASGSQLFTDKATYKIPTIKLKMIDATAAGDSFIGAIVSKVIQLESLDDQNIIKIIKYASAVGALTTQKHGALEAIPTKEEIEKFMTKIKNKDKKI